MSYQDDKSYLVSGAKLNQIERDIATLRLIKGAGIGIRRIPGTGTEIWTGASVAALPFWDLEIVDGGAGEVRLIRPGLIRRTSALDASGLVNVTDIGETFTAEVGKLLVLEVLPTLATSLKMIDEWDGWPMPIDSEETDPPGFWRVTKYYYPLFDFVAETAAHDAVIINDNLVAERRGYNGHLQFALCRQEDKDAHVVSAYELVPSTGARAV
mgnify:FL=1